MRHSRAVHRHDERGMTTAATAFAVGMSFVVLMWAFNGIVFWYVRGAARQSLNEGIHAAVSVGPAGNVAAACTDRINQALDGLLGSAIRPSVTTTCTTTDTTVEATASVDLTGFGGSLFGGVLTYSDTFTRRAPLELNPAERPGI